MSKKFFFKILLFATVITLIFVWFYRQNDKQKDFIDLENSVVLKNLEKDNTANVQIGNKEMVQIKFFWEVNGIRYNDALNLTKEQYEKLSQEEIEKMKQERFENWVKLVNEGSREE